MNEIKTYFLTPEEIAQRYGAVQPQKKEMYIKPRYVEREPRINVDRYREFKESGYTDRKIQEELHISYSTLRKWKQRWGIIL
jgi:DNA invertase Pin-like site-specific DNA recombinase